MNAKRATVAARKLLCSNVIGDKCVPISSGRRFLSVLGIQRVERS
jgi:hypothetical protein